MAEKGMMMEQAGDDRAVRRRQSRVTIIEQADDDRTDRR